MIRFLLIMPLVFFMSCKKNEFQSCTNYDQLVGEWESINSDTKNTIEFIKNGKIIKKCGLERKQKITPFKCSNNSNEESEGFYFYYKENLMLVSSNLSHDTLLAGFGAQDISEDTTMLFKMKFVKLK
ncbi:MAG: hypothetical protein ACO1O6_10240 [Bacteroidota bacterium]